VTLHVWAVGEKTFLKEPTRAALALFVPIRALVKMLARKISNPCFVSEHADFTVGDGIFNQRIFLSVLSFAFLLVAFVVIVLFAFSPRSCTRFKVSFGTFIEKVGGGVMLKEPR